MTEQNEQIPVVSSSEEESDYDDSTDSSEREFIEQQQKMKKEQERVHLPRKSSTIKIEKKTQAVIVDDENIDHDEFDSDDEDMNCSNLSVYETVDRCEIAIAHTAGRRNYNEDRACVYSNIEGNDIFAVFDGHNGHEGATLCRNELKETYKKCEKDIIKTFENLHQQVIKVTGAGCTATVVIMKENEIEFANCGDSCAYILKKDGKLEKMTYDHKASDAEEEKMIVANGGCVMNIFGAKRVNGQIMVTRSIGDRSLHPPMSCIPHISVCKIEDVKSICIMSDGVTDVINDEGIKDIMLGGGSVVERVQLLRNKAYKGGSRDNICAIVIDV